MLVSKNLTTGQITFILRAVIQVVSYGGLFIIGLIILGNTPRIAPIETHDVLNRIVAKSTTASSSLKWMAKRIRRNDDPTPSFRLFLVLLLSLFYTLFISLSDIGFIGFNACFVSGPSTLDFPASVRTDADALNLIRANLVNGTDPGSVYSRRCDSAEPPTFDANEGARHCTSWRNGTYSDANTFRGLNSTDSDVLMPLQLAGYETNTYYLGISSQRVRRPVVANGLAIAPHDQGLRVITGVPKLSNQQKVVIPKTLALEVDVGCMDLGIYAMHDMGSFAGPDSLWDIYRTSDETKWKNYTGPDYLREVLSRTTDTIRKQLLPIFNASHTIGDDIISYNSSWGFFSWRSRVGNFFFPPLPGGIDFRNEEQYILGNCTQQLNAQLGLSLHISSALADSCGLLQIGGSFTRNQKLFQGISRMVCATATQVNMVRATVEMDAVAAVTVNLTRLPSNLHFIDAQAGQIQRYVLSDNATGPSSHFIVQEYDVSVADFLEEGFGSAGVVLSKVGSRMIKTRVQEEIINELDDRYFQANFSNALLTRWAGEVGGSYILASLGYNGWAARDSAPLTVLSTGGHRATCFKTPYGAAFLPLFVAAFIIMCWGLFMLLSATVPAAKRLEKAYGGVTPYVRSLDPAELPKDALLILQSHPHPHFEIVPGGSPDDSTGFLLQEMGSPTQQSADRTN